FKELNWAFMKSLPCGDSTRPDGFYNLAAHFPVNALRPDLGPKMYISHASVHEGIHVGSTWLHLDVAAAVNIMLWAGCDDDGKPGCARWLIFAPDDRERLRCFLRRKLDVAQDVDPLLAQNVFVDDEMVEELTAEGIRVHKIAQYPGVAVFIPPGAPHQVSNAVDASKIAVDFVPPESLEDIQQLMREFRKDRLTPTATVDDDLLRLSATVWYAWLSI
ncbi:uncharacterized protein B0H18DRAFT_838935, partial [Fomitopsis serialis]|uniref:uncharacterized protein n=1 Tax=Fomitopsis serialis TaxID=139415 RepID=UPI002007E029